MSLISEKYIRRDGHQTNYETFGFNNVDGNKQEKTLHFGKMNGCIRLVSACFGNTGPTYCNFKFKFKKDNQDRTICFTLPPYHTRLDDFGKHEFVAGFNEDIVLSVNFVDANGDDVTDTNILAKATAFIQSGSEPLPDLACIF